MPWDLRTSQYFHVHVDNVDSYFYYLLASRWWPTTGGAKVKETEHKEVQDDQVSHVE